MPVSLSQTINQFFTVNNYRDISRILKLSMLISLQLGKFIMMWFCGCEVNELNNWLSTSIRDPYYWRIARDGTRFVAGPYSFIWYGLYSPAQFGYWTFMIYMFIIDTMITLFVFRYKPWVYIVPFMAGSIYFYNVDPIDAWGFWLSLLGQYSIIFSFLALIMKLPIGAPDYVWAFIMNNPYGLKEPGGWFRYSMIGVSWLAGIGLYLKRRRRRRLIADAVSMK